MDERALIIPKLTHKTTTKTAPISSQRKSPKWRFANPGKTENSMRQSHQATKRINTKLSRRKRQTITKFNDCGGLADPHKQSGIG